MKMFFLCVLIPKTECVACQNYHNLVTQAALCLTHTKLHALIHPLGVNSEMYN